MKAVLFVVALVAAGLIPGTAPIAQGHTRASLQIVTDGPLCTCVVGASHTHVFTARSIGNNGPYQWAVVDGALAPGKWLEVCPDGLTALVRGTATEAGEFQFTLAVWSVADPSIRDERAFRVELLPASRDAAPIYSQGRLPLWLPIAGGFAVAISFFPLLRHRRRTPRNTRPTGAQQ